MNAIKLAEKADLYELTQEELSLYESKWYAYRPYPPLFCDLLFAKQWVEAREKFLQKTKLDVRFDDEGKEYRLPWQWNNLKELMADTNTWGLLTGLRKVADRHCIPYKKFWSIAYSIVNQLDGWRNDLAQLSSSFIRCSIVERFDEEAQAQIIMSDRPELQAEGYIGLNFQIEYMNYVAAEVRKRYPNTADEKLQVLRNEGRWIDPSINRLIDKSKKASI